MIFTRFVTLSIFNFNKQKEFVPVIRTVKPEAVKKCDINNKDITFGEVATTVTLKIELDNEEYTCTNRRRLSCFFS